MKKLKSLLFIFSILAIVSCDDLSTDVNVDYKENPTSEELAEYTAANTFFQNWYTTVNAYATPALAMVTMADTGTCSWGNAGMRDTSSEPRVAWNNDTTYGNRGFTRNYFNALYSGINDINALMGKIVTGDDPADPSPRRTESITRFAQAATLGYVALVFDQVWLKDETGPLNDANSVTPMEALTFCLEKIDQAIAIAESNSFTVDGTFINGTTLTSAQWAQFLNTFAARLMVNMPRNAAQKAALDWGKVLAYANKGITYDLTVQTNGAPWAGGTWYNEWVIYQIFPGWGRVDMRVVNMMDPASPDYFTDASGVLPAATSNDNRLASDFQYLNSQDFIASRGIYHYSNYRHSRYDGQYHSGGWVGIVPEMLKAENDLYRAEATLKTSTAGAAAAIINAGTRVTRGGLAPVASTVAAVEEAIHYERTIELFNTSIGLAFFDMRGRDMLQAGTPLHFPVPGEVLLSGGFDIYTFGGTTGVAGEDYSTSGWR